MSIFSSGSNSRIQKVTNYGGDTIEGNGLASIVGLVALTGQLSSIGSTSIFAPVNHGLYRVSIYQVCTVAGAVGTLSTSITFTDDIAAQSFQPALTLSLVGLNGFSQGVALIRALNTQPIKYSTTLTGIVGSPQYSLYIVAERLQ